MSSPFDLISLEQANLWLGLSGGGALTEQLITQISRQILTWIRRPSILPTQYTDVIDGQSNPRVTLKNWPVTAVASVIVDNLEIPPSPFPTSGVATASRARGYYLQPWDGLPPGSPQRVDIYDWTFPAGRANIAVTYTAGYQMTDEPGVVPAAPATYSPSQPFGAWASDVGVTYADGTPLTAVDAIPAQGQYQVDDVGNYTFNAADVGVPILVSYGYVPADLANAAMQWVGELGAYQSRVGLRSKALGGQETISFYLPGYGQGANPATAGVPPFVQSSLWPYRRVIQT